MLQRVTKGKIKRPIAVLIYGPDGIGKSTFAADAPKPIFLGSERGTDNIDVARFPMPKTWNDVTNAIKELTLEQHDYKTLAIDSLDWLEPLLHRTICDEYNVKTIERAAGGYGKGYIEAANRWCMMKDQLEELRTKKEMNIILIGHCEVINFMDPQTQFAYHRYQLKLHKTSGPLFREYVDTVLFANYELFTKEDGNNAKTISGGRVMYTEKRPGWDAKNRFGLPLMLDLGWQPFIDAINKATETIEDPETLKAKISEMLTYVIDESLRLKVVETVEKAGNNASQLAAVANRLAVRINEPQV